MTTFDDRERAFENLFAHDQELAFRAQARRDHAVALWAAGHLGLAGAEAEAYAAALLTAATEGNGDETVVAKLLADFKAGDVHISEHQIRRHMQTELAVASERLKTE